MSAPERAGGIRALTASWRPAEIGLVALRVVAVVTVLVGVPHYPDSAAHRFYDIAHHPGVPWRDTPVEYAIGDYVVIRAVGWGSLSLARGLLAVVVRRRPRRVARGPAWMGPRCGAAVSVAGRAAADLHLPAERPRPGGTRCPRAGVGAP